MPWRTTMLCLPLALWTACAHAGAWPQPEGTGVVIVTTAREVAPAGSFFGGDVDDSSNFSQIFVEYGVYPGVTLGVSAFGEFSDTVANDVTAALRAHVRGTVWTGASGDIAAVQVGGSLPVERWLGNGLGDDRPDSVPEAELRLLYGRGWQTDWGDSFVSTELGFRWRSESQEDELLLDTTVGLRPINELLALMRVFTTLPFGDDASLKLGPSLAYTAWPWLGSNDKKPAEIAPPETIEFGITWDALNPDDGLTVGVSIWRRF